VPGWLQVALGIALLLVVALGLGAFVAWRDARVRLAFRLLRQLRNRERIGAVRAIAADPRLPWAARAIPFVLVAYLAMPFDLIPDFIPLLGQLDDLVVIALALWLLVRLVPPDLIEEHLGSSRTEPGSEPL